jgi:short-subunit dehydrogenase
MRIDATTRALVTGGSRGIGLELARAVAARGAAVGLLARSADEAQARELSGSGVSVTTVFPGEIATHLHDHEKDSLPDWYHAGDRAADPARLAAAVLRAVERDRRAVSYPPAVRLLGVNGIAPRLADAVVRRLRGGTAAPRRD